MSGKFYVFRCKRCGRWGVKELRVELRHGTYTCRYESCKKTSKIKKKTEYGLAMSSYGPYDTPNIGAEICGKLNGAMRKK